MTLGPAGGKNAHFTHWSSMMILVNIKFHEKKAQSIGIFVALTLGEGYFLNPPKEVLKCQVTPPPLKELQLKFPLPWAGSKSPALAQYLVPITVQLKPEASIQHRFFNLLWSATPTQILITTSQENLTRSGITRRNVCSLSMRDPTLLYWRPP